MKNSSSVEYIAAATSVRVSKNLELIPFDLKTRSQDFINQVRVELGYPSENAGFCSGKTELFPEKKLRLIHPANLLVQNRMS